MKGRIPRQAPDPAESPRRSAWIVLVFVLLLLAASGVFSAVVLARPSILAITPSLAETGAVVSIVGSNFGAQRGDSRIEVDGVSPTSASYLSWSPTLISVRFPGTVDSGLVYVFTEKGRSNPKLFMNKARLPVAATSVASGGSGPWLSSLSSERGQIGTLLTLTGTGFGNPGPDRSVRFPWSPEDPPVSRGERPAGRTISGTDLSLSMDSWSDREIRVRVPDGAVSGAVFVQSPQGDSNSLFFGISEMPGSKRVFDRRSYSVTYSVELSRIQASGSNELFLRVPIPVESPNQTIVRSLAMEPSPFSREFSGLALYRFRDLGPGQNQAVNLSWLVQCYSVETKVDPDRIRMPETPGALETAWIGADSLVPATEPAVVAVALQVTGGERNPFRAARLINDWLVRKLAWHEERDRKSPVEALAAGAADSWNYGLVTTALLRAAGIPAIPVAGLLVDSSRKTVHHSWVEFRIPGFGWVPMDPILASGARPGGFEPAFEESARYFGNLDNRHLAFSRGVGELKPLAANGRRAMASYPIAYQDCYEESAGAIEAYTSFWSEVEVTGMY